jgi:uncharacterized membrane protein YgdD (TMEM256/DUF423 family)
MSRLFLVTGAGSAFLAVALGAFAAHLLKDRLAPELFQVFEVGVRYHMYHAFALIAVGILAAVIPGTEWSAAGWLFAAGTVLFSGSLYVLSLTGVRWLGMITPVGGLCFLAGWVWIAWSAWKSL